MKVTRGANEIKFDGTVDPITIETLTKETIMTAKRKTILMRFVRSGAAMLVSFLAAWVAGPDAADLVGTDMQTFIVAVGVPFLVSLDKNLRYGRDNDDA